MVPVAGLLSAPEPHRGGVAPSEGICDAQTFLRFRERIEGGCDACFATAGGRGSSIFTWRYLTLVPSIAGGKGKRDIAAKEPGVTGQEVSERIT